MNIRIVNLSKHPLPSYETGASAWMDLRTSLETPVTLKPLERTLIPAGLFIKLPVGFEAQIGPRSGMPLKKGISLVNTPGTIDADYRGEIKPIVINLSQDKVVIEDGERVAQKIIVIKSKSC